MRSAGGYWRTRRSIRCAAGRDRPQFFCYGTRLELPLLCIKNRIDLSNARSAADGLKYAQLVNAAVAQITFDRRFGGDAMFLRSAWYGAAFEREVSHALVPVRIWVSPSFSTVQSKATSLPWRTTVLIVSCLFRWADSSATLLSAAIMGARQH